MQYFNGLGQWPVLHLQLPNMIPNRHECENSEDKRKSSSNRFMQMLKFPNVNIACAFIYYAMTVQELHGKINSSPLMTK